jgi:Cytidylate kinase-like family
MAVIALTSGMGTGVKYVAEKVARRLGLELVYREICPLGHEIPSTATNFSPAAFGSRWEAGLAWLKACRHVDGLASLEDLVRTAQRGNVLICGATPLHFLSAVTHATTIRVRMTMALRVRRIMACMDTDEPESALQKILQGDRNQSDTLRRMFGIDNFEDAGLYDAVIDIGREPAETCALQIASIATQSGARNAFATKATLDGMLVQVQAVRQEVTEQRTETSLESTNRSR